MNKYLGIRYARAKRFEKPIAEPLAIVPQTEGQFGPCHHQIPFGTKLVRLPGTSDDCLNLNIWTPSNRTSPKPVVVWIYGGGFEFGSAADFDGELLADEQQVVVVSINYRVGFLGFGYLPGELPSNLGLRDVICGIQWVMQNIHNFGGDPSNLTIMGQSAGGFLSTAAVASEELKNQDLKLVAMSGAASRLVTLDDAESLSRKWLDFLGVKSLEETLSLDLDQLLVAQRQIIPRDFGARNGPRINALGVTLDSALSDSVLSDHPFQIISRSPDPVLVTVVASEMAPLRKFDPRAFDEIDSSSVINEVCGFAQSDSRGKQIAAEYQKRFPALGDMRENILTDYIYRLPAARLASARPQRTWLLEFESPEFWGHGADVPLLFPKTPDEIIKGAGYRSLIGRFAYDGDLNGHHFDQDRTGLLFPNLQTEVSHDWLLTTWEGVDRP